MLFKISEKNIGTRLKQISIQEKSLKIGITIMAIGFLKKMFSALVLLIFEGVYPKRAESLELKE